MFFSSSQKKLSEIARLVRYNILISTTAAGSGHPSSSLSATDIMTTLMFGGFFRADLKHPEYNNNDRLIFSKGHAAPLFYALYAAAGMVTSEEMQQLRKFGARLEGHPTMRFPFTEAATGSLGQGLSIGVGMAINAKYLDKLDYKTYVLMGDSEMAEGSIYEAMELAIYYKLNNLVAIVDVNRLGERGETMVGYDTNVYQKKAEAFGWEAIVIDGHNLEDIKNAFTKAKKSAKPVMIIAKTIKGKGVSFMENKEGWHGKAMNEEQLGLALKEIGPVNEKLVGKIVLPKNLQKTGKKIQKSSAVNSGELHASYKIGQMMATREAYGVALTELGKTSENVVALDAEVSNSTFSDKFKKDFPERFFEMFIAEQNMVGAAVGLAARGKIPFVSTFAAFFTRAFDQLRMAAYSAANIKCVGSHCGVSIGEDGTSQMGLEDIALFRSIFGSIVLYPSDAVATRELVKELMRYQGLGYLRTTRMALPVLYKDTEKFVIGGSKTLCKSAKDVVTVVGAGITLHEALKAYEILRQQGIFIRVIDLYSIKPIDSKTLALAAKQTQGIVIVEDHYAAGGMAEAVRTALSGVTSNIYSLCVTKMPQSGKPQELINYEDISEKAIVTLVKKILRQR